jgi:hypothetical protein
MSTYGAKKAEFDEKVLAYLTTRLTEDIKSWEGVKGGIIDELGQRLKASNEADSWKYTPLDSLIYAIRAEIGDDKLKNALDGRKKYVDDLLVIKSDSSKNLDGISETNRKIVEIMDPVGLYHDFGIRTDPYDNEDKYSEIDKLRLAYTVLNTLLYAMRLDRAPVPKEFSDIQQSVEDTFSVRAYGDWDEILNDCKGCSLMSNREILKKGLSLVVECAPIIAKCKGLLQEGGDENMAANWRKLATLRT